MPRLVVEKGNDKGRTYPVPAKGTVIIGRDTSAHIQLRDTMSSRMHVKVEEREDGWWIVDMESMNGTLLNNVVVREAKLQFGDLVKIGETLLSFLGDDAAAESTLIGQRLGGYRIQERVGRGGMGTVYRAEQVDLQRSVALKVISDEHSKNKEFVELFVHEARAAAKLNHPNIVQVYDVKKSGDLYYFSMEFVPGGSVQDLLNKQRKVPVEQSVQMILDAARGLEYAHKKEIIHRDVKPDNFMIAESGSIKIGDLGLAQRLGEKLSADDENSVIGTPHYIAPEQVLGKPADYRSDIYALGSTLYRMVAGFTPYQAPSVRDLINKKVREDAVPLHEACPGVPKRLGEVCAKMMSRTPENRYQTMTEVIIDIERLQREMSGAGERQGTSSIEALVGNKRLLVAAIALMMVIVVIGVVAGVVVFKKPPEPVVVPPTDTGDREADANRAFDNAKTIRLALNLNSADDLQRGIREFGDVIERYPGTKAAESAAREKGELETRLLGVRAWIEFQTVEALDVANWVKVRQGFQADRLDLSPIEGTITAYAAFRAGAGKDTPAGENAEARARHIRTWLERVAKAQADFATVKPRADQLVDAKRFQEAWEQHNQLIGRCEAAKMACDFANDRYTGVLYDAAATAEQTNIVRRAQVAWLDIERASKEAEAAKDFDKAIQLLQPAVEHSIPQVVNAARVRQNQLENAAAIHRREMEMAAAEEAKRRLEADRADFDRLAQEIRKLVREFRFKAAVERLAEKPGAEFPRTDTYKTRVTRRLDDLRRLTEFKDTFSQVWNDDKNAAGVSKVWKEPGLDGTVKKIQENEIVISIVGGGTTDKAFSTIPPKQFVDWVRASWKKNVLTGFQCGLAVLCLEFGLYEQATEVLQGLEKTEDWSKNKVLRDWVEEMRRRIRDGDSSDSKEIEAERRFERFAEAVAAGDVDAALAHLEVLKSACGDTAFLAVKREDVDRLAAQLKQHGGEDLARKVRESAGKRVEQVRKRERQDAQKAAPDVLGRLGRLRDPLDRDFHLGEALAGQGEWDRSSARLKDARNSALQRIAQGREGAKAVVPRLAGLYAGLMRNSLVGGSPQMLQQIRNEANSKFGEIDGAKGWWDAALAGFDRWEAEHNRVKPLVPKLTRTVEDQPEDPKALWELAAAHVVTRNFVEARACLRALIEVYPDFESVRSGDAMVYLAEALYGLREIKEALPLYAELARDFKQHPKVSGKDPFEGVQARLDACYELLSKMYPGEEPPRREPGRPPKK